MVYISARLSKTVYVYLLATNNSNNVIFFGHSTLEMDYHPLLLLAERALSRDYPCKIWSSETLYLSDSRARAIIHYSLLHVE